MFQRAALLIPDDHTPGQAEVLTLNVAEWLREAHEQQHAPKGLPHWAVTTEAEADFATNAEPVVEVSPTDARDVWARCIAVHSRFEELSLEDVHRALAGLNGSGRTPYFLRAAELVVKAKFHTDARMLARNAGRLMRESKEAGVWGD